MYFVTSQPYCGLDHLVVYIPLEHVVVYVDQHHLAFSG